MKKLMILLAAVPLFLVSCDPTGDTKENRNTIYSELPIILYEENVEIEIGEILPDVIYEVSEWTDSWSYYGIDWVELGELMGDFIDISLEEFDYGKFRQEHMHRYSNGQYGMPTYTEFAGYEWEMNRAVDYYDYYFAVDVVNNYKGCQYDLTQQEIMLRAAEYIVAMAHYKAEMPKIKSCEFIKKGGYFEVRTDIAGAIYVKFYRNDDGSVSADFSEERF